MHIYDPKNKAGFDRVVKADRYRPSETRDQLDFAVVFFSNTGQARLFPTVERVSAWYHNDIYRARVFTSAQQLASGLSDERLFELYKQWYVTVPAKSSWLAEKRRQEGDTQHKPEPFRLPKSAEKLAQRLWKMIQEKADRVTGVAPQQINPKFNERRFIFDMAKLTLALEEKWPKQCRIIMQALNAAGLESYTEEAMEDFMRNLKRDGQLKTKQDSMLVFKFYAPQLADKGILDYQGRRKTDDEGEAALSDAA